MSTARGGECAGYGSIRTELWETSDRTHRFKCTFVLPPVDDIQHDARQYEPKCMGVPAVWNTAGIKGQYGNAFMRTYKRARGIYDLPRVQGDPLVQSFIEFFRNRMDANGVSVAE